MDTKAMISDMLSSYGELITPDQAREFLHVGRNYIYEKIKCGEITCLRFGNAVRIPKNVFRDFLVKHLVNGG